MLGKQVGKRWCAIEAARNLFFFCRRHGEYFRLRMLDDFWVKPIIQVRSFETRYASIYVSLTWHGDLSDKWCIPQEVGRYRTTSYFESFYVQKSEYIASPVLVARLIWQIVESCGEALSKLFLDSDLGVRLWVHSRDRYIQSPIVCQCRRRRRRRPGSCFCPLALLS